MSQNSKRGKGFTTGETKQLCMSWKKISEDPIKGTDQSLTLFWTAVQQDAQMRMESFASRTPDGLRQRWGVVSRAIQKFAGCYKSIIRLNESGTNDEDKLEKALLLYRSENKEEFRFLDSWEILRSTPKFATSTEGTSGSTSTSPLCTTPVSANRPVGRNTAKNAAKSDALESRRVEALERIAAASEKKVNLFAEYTAALQQQNRIQVATTRLDGLDAYSAKILLIEKQRLLAEFSSTTTSGNTEEDESLIEVDFDSDAMIEDYDQYQ